MTDLRFKSRAHIVKHLLETEGDICYLCDLPFSDKNRPTIEHVHPLSKGGTWDLDNLRLAHKKCNTDKGNRVFVDGVLEPKSRRIGYRERKAGKAEILDRFCDVCYDGRLLLPDETCEECDRSAVAMPWTLKVEPKQCDHDRNWCWACSIGIYERRPALNDLIMGEDG